MKRTALMLASLLALPFASQAADLSYSWVEADYVHVNPDDFDNSDGVAVRGSGELGENFNVIAGWSQINVDTPLLDDLKSWYLGIGYHTPVGEKTDLFTDVAYIKNTTLDNDGVGARVGVRSALSPKFEGAAWVGYEKLDHTDGNGSLGVSGQYKFTDNFGLVAEARVAENDKSFLVGPRLSF
ncbi:MAG TPA: hypothetical protein VLF18_15105 [Tahibacter sp.]|uniref:hypothetical protein n=1 Tax=Tahibacter sp. TaxID=2056211 RepID=UPI002B65ADB5|nr:hypothetical protein [Tahibacter sp.]HSX61528.1 hypothetical protein [Tahibacter sp.]